MPQASGFSLKKDAAPFVPRAANVTEATEVPVVAVTAATKVDEKPADESAEKKKKKKAKQRAKTKFVGPQTNQVVVDALLRDSIAWLDGSYSPPADGDDLMR